MGDIDNMDFSFVTRVSIPNPKGTNRKVERLLGAPLLAFSADGTKFAAGTADGVVSVWDVRSKTPLKVLEVDVPTGRGIIEWPIWYLQFSSGISGREVLVFTEVGSCLSSKFPIINGWTLGQKDHSHN